MEKVRFEETITRFVQNGWGLLARHLDATKLVCILLIGRKLPHPARAPMRVAVESYMQIGRELQTPGYKVKAGRATVPVGKRLWVAWRGGTWGRWG